MRRRSRAVSIRCLIAGVLLLAAATPAAAARVQHWEVTFAVRIAGANGGPVSVRLALPVSTDTQRISGLEMETRGLEARPVTDTANPHLLLRGRLKGPRRISVSYQIASRRERDAVPRIEPVSSPTANLLPYLTPSPIFQSRSILVREFLETYAAPKLGGAEPHLMRAILEATREQIEHRSDGKSLVLDVIRSRRAQRIGLERSFTTFLRCARIPARMVEGIDVKHTTKHKRVFWTEVWAQKRWWPVSASRGLVGKLPATWVALTRDGEPVVGVDGAEKASYVVETRRLDDLPGRTAAAP
jgi:hypothetical protein